MLNPNNKDFTSERNFEIVNIWDEFMSYHMDHPELRFMQIINSFQWFLNKYHSDDFYYEDQLVLERIKEFVKFLERKD